MPTAKVFSNSSVSMSNYGTAGMPKVIVLGGPNHTVFYNQNGALNVSSFNTAINDALTAAATGIAENFVNNFQLSLFPNPVTNRKSAVSYYLKNNEEITIDIYNTLGAKVKNVLKEQQAIGKHEQQIDLSTLSTGVYLIKLCSEDKTDLLKLVISE